ncbi:MAG: DUF128 domain-containing protein [Planctomycetota bacterium]
MEKNPKLHAVLSVLGDNDGPLNSRAITQQLLAAGQRISERTVRLYLKEGDELGLTESHGRKGRTLTEAGHAELRISQVVRRVGYLSGQIDRMTYQMTFDLHTRSGTVVVNTSVVDAEPLLAYADDICRVFERGYAMGRLLTILKPGERIGKILIPEGKLGFCTVCSVTLNGVLLKHGIPITSRFGGLIELQDGAATRFAEMIHYDGTSIDPLEVFIRSGMTDYCGAIRSGNGRIGASFREIPCDARPLVGQLATHLDEIGMGAVLAVGLPGQAVLEVPVPAERVGMVVIGGLNPVAILEETGHRIFSRALSGQMEFTRLQHYEELPKLLNNAM